MVGENILARSSLGERNLVRRNRVGIPNHFVELTVHIRNTNYWHISIANDEAVIGEIEKCRRTSQIVLLIIIKNGLQPRVG